MVLAKRLRKEFSSKKDRKTLKRRLALLKRCKYRHIQDAINHAKSGYRIQIMPGVYKEEPSRKVPYGAPGKPPCANDYVTVEEGYGQAPPPAGPRSNDKPEGANRNYAIKCPNSKNLIAVIGDTRPEPDPKHPIPPQCNQLCNVQIEGMGKRPQDVNIVGDRIKTDVVRIDRANGIHLRNFMVEQAAFNDVDIIEVDGFVVQDVIARWAQNYGILSFTATHGLYDRDIGYGNGDSGLYPGSTMKGCATNGTINPNEYGTCEQPGCGQPSIEIRNSESYGNTLGYSGTAGNSTYVHDNKFHDNATGLTTDSFASGHPGMPQECFRWESNQIYSNNNNVFDQERQKYCASTSFAARKKDIVCPQFQTAVGTGVLIGGGNRNQLKNNFIYDNWRYGFYLLSVPAGLRGDNDPSHQQDTSNQNVVSGNTMGTSPDGKRMPNGLEVEWDGSGQGNCFENNKTRSASDPRGAARVPGLANLHACESCGAGRGGAVHRVGSQQPARPTRLRLVQDAVEAEMSRALGIAAIAVAIGGCGGGDKPDAGRLAWIGKPNVFKARNLPNDRVVIARVRNTGTKTLHLTGAKLVVRDSNGKALKTTAAFNTTFAHGLYGALQHPAGGPPAAELMRLGKAIYLPAGGSAPFYAAWRLKPGTKEPVRIDYGTGSLAVPTATGTAR